MLLVDSELTKVMVDDGVPTTSRRTVMDRFPLAMLDCAKLVKSKSTKPSGGVRVNVERVTSVVEHVGAAFHVTLDSVKLEHAYAATVREVGPTVFRYIRSSICVGVMAVGQGKSERSTSMRMASSPLPPDPCPRLRLDEAPLFVFGFTDEIVTSFTEGTPGALVNTEFLLSVSV